MRNVARNKLGEVFAGANVLNPKALESVTALLVRFDRDEEKNVPDFKN